MHFIAIKLEVGSYWAKTFAINSNRVAIGIFGVNLYQINDHLLGTGNL